MAAESNPSPREFSRRMFLRRGASVLGAAALPSVLAGCDVPFMSKSETPEFPVESPEEALQRLMEGNARYAAGKSGTINESIERRDSLVKRQRPFAAVFSCVDSRVPPELVFDRGLGDLFVIRTAGQVLDSAVMGSLEYGAYELEIPLLVVMGHTKCGAMKATIETLEAGGKAEGSIEYLVEALAPAAKVGPGKEMALKESAGEGATEGEATASETTAEGEGEGDAAAAEAAGEPVASETTAAAEASSGESGTETTAAEGEAGAAETTASEGEAAAETTAAEGEGEATGETTAEGEPAGETVDPKAKELTEAIKRNVTLVIDRIKKSAIVEERVKKDRLLIVGAIYDIETGIVEFTDNVPAQFKTAETTSAETTAE